MPGKRGDLNVRIGLLLQGFDKEINSALRSLNKFAQQAAQLGTNLSLSVTAPIAVMGSTALQAAIEFDRMEQALVAITGSAAAAQAQLADIRALAELPGISYQQAAQTTLQLQGLGFTAEKARETILQVGNAIAASGGTQQNFEGVIRQLAQIEGKNKVLQEDIRILIENAPILGKILKDTFGGSTAEAIRKAGFNGEQFVDKLLEKLAELPKVQGGLANAFENLGIAAKFALARIGQESDRVFGVKELFEDLANVLNRASDVFVNLDDDTKRAILRLVAFAAAAGPVIFGVSRLAFIVKGYLGISKFLTGNIVANTAALFGYKRAVDVTSASAMRLNTIMKASFAGLALAGVALLVSELIKFSKAVRQANAAIEERVTATGALADVERNANAEIAERTALANELIAIAQDETKAEAERTAAIQQLKKEYPDYFGKVSEDLSQTGKLTAAKERLAEALLVEARARAASTKITELATKQAEIEEQVTKNLEKQANIRKELAALGFSDVGAAEAQANANRQRIIEQSRSGRDVNASLLREATAVAALVGEFQSLQAEINRNNADIDALSVTMSKLAQEAAKAKIELKGIRNDATDNSKGATGLGKKLSKEQKILEKYRGELRGIAAEAEFFKTPALEIDEQKAKAAIKALRDLAEAGLESSGAFKQVTADLSVLFPKIEFTGQLIETKDAFVEFRNALQGANFDKRLFKEQQEDAKELKSLMEELSESASKWGKELKKAADDKSLKRFKVFMDGLSETVKPLTEAFNDFYITVFEGGKDAFKSFRKALTEGFKELAAQILAVVSAATLLTVILSTVVPIFGVKGLGLLAKIKKGGSLFGGILRGIGGIPFFGDGGVVTSPTLAVIGEKGPEAVVPLSKLNVFGNSEPVIGGEFIIRGTDLVLAVERNQTQRKRSRGI